MKNPLLNALNIEAEEMRQDIINYVKELSYDEVLALVKLINKLNKNK